ncbi:MAG: endonuclease Q family protein [Syntrophomonadaceae bacterium]
MQHLFGDLHVHIGRAGNNRIKITASKSLDLKSIIFSYAPRKGLGIVGVVDAGSTAVSAEIEELLEAGHLIEQEKGGLLAANGILLITGCEVETSEGFHVIIYLPYMDSIRKLQKYLKTRVNNLVLSTQKVKATVVDLINLAAVLDGILCLAHAFTPHKGIYGFWTSNIKEKIGEDINHIGVLELGLSADTDMADMIEETRNFTFLTNSDAHSAANIGREYNQFRVQDKSFQELRYCFKKEHGRRVTANYGMDPLLGKYHRSYCLDCSTITSEKPPVTWCHTCGSNNLVMGVYDRIALIRDFQEPHHPLDRPPYNYRVPLKDLPGVGPRAMEKLLNVFPNEIYVTENAPVKAIARITGNPVAQLIEGMRAGRLLISPGGGGRYGKVKKPNNYQ